MDYLKHMTAAKAEAAGEPAYPYFLLLASSWLFGHARFRFSSAVYGKWQSAVRNWQTAFRTITIASRSFDTYAFLKKMYHSSQETY